MLQRDTDRIQLSYSNERVKRHKADAVTYSDLGWRTDTGQRKAKWLLRAAVPKQLVSTKDRHGFTKDLGKETHSGVSLPSFHYWYSDVIT